MACKVAVPSQLESLTKEQLIKVVQDLVEERSQRSDEASRKHKVVDDAGSQTPKKQRTVQVAHRGDESAEKQPKVDGVESTLSHTDKSKLLASLAKKCVAAIKKTAHNHKKKPYTQVCEGISSCDALALLGTLGNSSGSARIHKRSLSPAEVVQFLGIEEVHPVKFDRKVWCLPSDNGFAAKNHSVIMTDRLSNCKLYH